MEYRIDNTGQETLDIDWFFTNTENIGFVASAGGKLPESVAQNWDESRWVVSFLKQLPDVSEVVINPRLSEAINGKVDDRYLFDFLTIAKKGIFAFDKTALSCFSDLNYHLVASPVSPLNFKVLPEELKKLLIKSRYEGAMPQMLNIGAII